MVDINNLTRIKIDKNILRKLAQKVLTGEKKTRTEISIALVGPSEMQKLNKKYRQKNRPTDVLSFTYNDGGEIIICPQVVKKNAEKLKEAFKKELYLVLIHGILHALGYDHGKTRKDAQKMELKQNYYLKK